MGCKKCGFENLQRVEGELTASFPNLEGIVIPPVYLCQTVLVCLDCGFAELVIPPNELQSLREGKAALGSKSAGKIRRSGP
jgi:hypothetical protein